MTNKIILIAGIPLFFATFFYSPAIEYFLMYLCFIMFYFLFVIIKNILSVFVSIMIIVISLAASSYFYVENKDELKQYFSGQVSSEKL